VTRIMHSAALGTSRDRVPVPSVPGEAEGLGEGLSELGLELEELELAKCALVSSARSLRTSASECSSRVVRST
jgi:hypothetical protein